ncbi:hypothetical protein EV1_028005 [Malus domestica]
MSKVWIDLLDITKYTSEDMTPHSETVSEILFCVHRVGVEVVVHQIGMRHYSVLWFVRTTSNRATSLRLLLSWLTHHGHSHSCCSVLFVVPYSNFFIRLLAFSSHLRPFFFQFGIRCGPLVGIQRGSKVGIHCKLELKEIEFKVV